MSHGNLNNIYNLLLAGKILQLEFPNREAANYFRIKLSQIKKRYDDKMLSIGMIEQRQQLVSTITPFPIQDDLLVAREVELDLGLVEARVIGTFKFVNKVPVEAFSFKILEEDGSTQTGS